MEQVTAPDPEAGQETPAATAGEQPLAPDPDHAEPTDQTPQNTTPPLENDGQSPPPDATSHTTEDTGPPHDEQDPPAEDPTAREPVPAADLDDNVDEVRNPPEDTTWTENQQRPVPDPFASDRPGLDPEPGESPTPDNDALPPAPAPDEAAVEQQADDAEHQTAAEHPTADEHRDEVDAEQDRAEEAGWDEVRDLLPADDSGRQLTPEDCVFLGIAPDQVRDWSDRSAPLGMTPEQYTDFRSSLSDALRADGIDPAGVDARLQGSSAHFFSGRHKDFPARDDLAGNPEAQARYDEWIGEGTPPQRRPFDSMNRLGVEGEDPSDYDVQLSSDQMVERAEALRQEEYSDIGLFHPKYDFVTKELMDRAFPNLSAWRRSQEANTGREVAPAVFPGGGPPDRTLTSKNGMSAHFRDDDWKIEL
ncbi:hypothetical protein [Micromonospora sp. NPDC049274]|uniref:hypothetical protein n=1 Tax=Micromonospora sp. NPDC049274 TaxID=3154829 RepID=UPI0034475AD6